MNKMLSFLTNSFALLVFFAFITMTLPLSIEPVWYVLCKFFFSQIHPTVHQVRVIFMPKK